MTHTCPHMYSILPYKSSIHKNVISDFSIFFGFTIYLSAPGPSVLTSQLLPLHIACVGVVPCLHVQSGVFKFEFNSHYHRDGQLTGVKDLMELIKHMQMDMGNHVDYRMDY